MDTHRLHQLLDAVAYAQGGQAVTSLPFGTPAPTVEEQAEVRTLVAAMTGQAMTDTWLAQVLQPPPSALAPPATAEEPYRFWAAWERARQGRRGPSPIRPLLPTPAAQRRWDRLWRWRWAPLIASAGNLQAHAMVLKHVIASQNQMLASLQALVDTHPAIPGQEAEREAILKPLLAHVVQQFHHQHHLLGWRWYAGS